MLIRKEIACKNKLHKNGLKSTPEHNLARSCRCWLQVLEGMHTFFHTLYIYCTERLSPNDYLEKRKVMLCWFMWRLEEKYFYGKHKINGDRIGVSLI